MRNTLKQSNMQTKTLQMNRALRTALLVLLLNIAGMTKTYAYDFSAICETGQILYYNIIGANEVELTAPEVNGWNGFEKPIGNISLPESVQFEGAFYAVTAISAFAFNDCQELTGDLVIPNSVTTIGELAFANCTGLTGTLSLPNSISEIENWVFAGCGFSGNLVIPNSVTSIGSSAFSDCTGFTGRLFIPNAVTNIAYAAFADCSGFTSLFVSQSVTSLQGGSFLGCAGLEQIIIDENNPVYDSRNNCNAIIETSTNTLVRACSTTIIPNTVTAIANEAFSGCTGLNGGLVIPNSISIIGPEAFMGCTGLTGDLVIPNSVTTIGEYAFAGCTGLTGTLTLPNSITEIEPGVFARCGFSGNLVIPNSVTSIGSSAFFNCTGFTGHLVVPNSVTRIENDTFSGCIGITSVFLPQTILEIGKLAFVDCTGLTGELVLPDFVISIGAGAFAGCTSMTGVTIGKYIQVIGDSAFHQCPNLASVTILATQLPDLCGGGYGGLDVFGFYNDPSIAILRVPCGYKSLYEEWGCANEFSTIIEDCDLHAISINNTSSNGGSVSLSSNSANLGDEIQITVTPNTGMSLSSLTVFSSNDPSQTIPVYPIGKTSSTYGFSMPYYDVTVKAVFTHGNAVGEDAEIPISVYPNPTNGPVKIEAESIRHVTISNAFGQVIYEGKTEGDVFEYDFGRQEAGVYLVRIETANGIVVKKVSVTR